ncbi:ester cyclase [Adhaeribacter radiodurans]|uniref:Ester cyclase n=1 Tax=Adhaeribacter radiodurans TaxID=2745197 RepID=A0A7L7L913_9BACT|nr:ester cyclase [Adhaeribacter radiodurans]QMU29311.1 ester cyclase [Adhaeribacter radiodurans]
MMTTEESRQFILEYIGAISNSKSEAVIDKYVADPELKGHVLFFEAGLPNYQLIPKDIITEGNKVVIRFVLEGEHKGDLFGIPPTGRKVSTEGIIIYEVDNNKIVKHWMQADSNTLMQQLSAVKVNS